MSEQTEYVLFRQDANLVRGRMHLGTLPGYDRKRGVGAEWGIARCGARVKHPAYHRPPLGETDMDQICPACFPTFPQDERKCG